MTPASQQVVLGDTDPTHDNVLTQVNVYSVYFGKGWELYTDLQNRIDAFLTFLVSSPYMDMFANAGNQDGKHGYTDAAGNPIQRGQWRGRKVPDSQPDLGQEWAPDWNILHPQLRTILLGPASSERFTLFMIFTPPGVSITDENIKLINTHAVYPPSQANTWGAWWVTYALCSVPKDLAILDPSSPDYQVAFDFHTFFTSHVIAEALTDANGRGGGWAGTDDIADLAENVTSNPRVYLTDPGDRTKYLVTEVVAKDGVTLLRPAGATSAETPLHSHATKKVMFRQPRRRPQAVAGALPRVVGYPTSIPAVTVHPSGSNFGQGCPAR